MLRTNNIVLSHNEPRVSRAFLCENISVVASAFSVEITRAHTRQKFDSSNQSKCMKKSLLIIFCIGCLLTACVSNHITWSANDNIRKVALGMSKEQVIQIMGKDYLVVSSAKDVQGNPVEVLAYKSAVDEEYQLKFVNAQLVVWNREHINKYIVKDPS